MHTRNQLKREMFAVRVDGVEADRSTLFPDWNACDRLGILIHEPFGAVGATHLIQLAITAFYDVRPTRRAGGLEEGDPEAIYPEVYLFHVGRPHGDHSYLDIWPSRKEVVVPNDARVVLGAINDRAITRLAVPDGAIRPVEHEWKEPAGARDRIVSSFAYSPTGRAANADIEIKGLTPATEFNTSRILDPDRVVGDILARDDAVPYADPDLISRRWETRAIARAGEAREGLAQAVARRERIRTDGLSTETYRRVELADALNMLVPAT